MSPSTPVLALAAGRVVVGGTLFVQPTLLAKGMGVDSATAKRTAWIVRMFAVRDLALGLGVLWAMNRSRSGVAASALAAGNVLVGGRGRSSVDPALREALLLGLLSDAGDAVAVLAALRDGSVRTLPAVATLATAAGAAGIGAIAASR